MSSLPKTYIATTSGKLQPSRFLRYEAYRRFRPAPQPLEEEFDITVEYRIQRGPLPSLWFRVRGAIVSFAHRKGENNATICNGAQ